MTTLPAPSTTGRHTAPEPPAGPRRRLARVVLAVAALVLVACGAATVVALLPAPAPSPAAPPAAVAAPTVPDSAAPSATNEIPSADPTPHVTVEALTRADRCSRAGCVVHHRVVNHGSAEVDGVFTVRAVGEEAVSITALSLPAGGSADITTSLPPALLAAHPGRSLTIRAEFRPTTAPTT